jgi:hypothetical protein
MKEDQHRFLSLLGQLPAHVRAGGLGAQLPAARYSGAHHVPPAQAARVFRLLALMIEAGSNTCIERTADLGTVRVQVYFRPVPAKYRVEIRGHPSGRWETCYELRTYLIH